MTRITNKDWHTTKFSNLDQRKVLHRLWELENEQEIEIDNLNRDYRNAFERLKAQEREIAQLKAEQKQAQIDMLEKLKSYVHCYFPNDDEDCVSQHVVLVSDIDMFINKIRSEQIKDVDTVIDTLQN